LLNQLIKTGYLDVHEVNCCYIISTKFEKCSNKHLAFTPEAIAEALKQLQEVARLGGNVFEKLMETVKVASLGQITDAMFNVGGQYRRNM